MAQWKFEEGVGWVYYDPPNPPVIPIQQIPVGYTPEYKDIDTAGPAGAQFSPQEYSLLKSEENLAPNFRVDRGLGQGSSNINYNSPPTQNAPNFAPVETNLGNQAVTYSDAPTQYSPNFAPVGTNDSAVTYGNPIGPDLRRGTDFGNEVPGARAISPGQVQGPDWAPVGAGSQVPGDDAVVDYTGPVAPNFGAGETRGTGTIGGDTAITEGQPIGPNFNNPTGTGPSDEYTGGGYEPVPAQGTQNAVSVVARAGTDDWRFKISLLPGSDVLYKDPAGDPYSIMGPLLFTDGVIFPYTPNVLVNYRANYEKIAPTHSNYPTYFYQNSEVSDVQINATFTAQSTEEADYMMAMIQFFRSVTKMFYGQDQNRGTPPPLVEVTGLGPDQFQFNKALITQFNYSLPDNVDYVRTSGGGSNSIDVLQRRGKLSGGSGNFGIFGIASRVGRLFGIGASEGAEPQYLTANEGRNLNIMGSSYVPSRIEISLTLLPVVTRKEQSTQWSLKKYANNDSMNGGWW